jgi:hypothetical protein
VRHIIAVTIVLYVCIRTGEIIHETS